MSMTTKASQLMGAVLCAALVACGSPEPVAYSGIDSSAKLSVNRQDESGRMPYRYATSVDWRTYKSVIMEPVTIYRGPDNQFGDMSEADKGTLANYMSTQFTEKLRHRFVLTAGPGPDTLRVKLTLTGAATSTPVLSTLSRFDLAGGLYNGVQSIRGGEGMMTGSVIYAVEIHDASTGRLLSAFISKQYPNALNIGASLGSLGAAKTGIEKGAEALVAYLK